MADASVSSPLWDTFNGLTYIPRLLGAPVPSVSFTQDSQGTVSPHVGLPTLLDPATYQFIQNPGHTVGSVVGQQVGDLLLGFVSSPVGLTAAALGAFLLLKD